MKTVFLIGGSGYIGVSLAKAIIKAGYNLVVGDLNLSRIDELSSKLKKK